MDGASPSQIHDVLSPPADSSFKPSDADVEIQDQAPPKNQDKELPIVRQPIGLSKKKKKLKKSLLGTLVSPHKSGLPMIGRQMSCSSPYCTPCVKNGLPWVLQSGSLGGL
ncbi:hypothetical protein Syun_001808 [Stephania yunnanensis]|uniref:Uncharacterized protein n=1 Tax=Stephania yunnanensis TaxID=152371 RepID=A0AAP0LFI6_9MAGN